MGLTYEEKVRIAEAGGHFQASPIGSWLGKKVRKGTKMGIVTSDMNGLTRILTVLFEDNTEEKIEMNNIGSDFQDNSAYEWLCDTYKEPKWYRF